MSTVKWIYAIWTFDGRRQRRELLACITLYVCRVQCTLFSPYSNPVMVNVSMTNDQ